MTDTQEAVEPAHTCQICGRVIKAKNGRIAHHGYKRPHVGWQTASCMGARGLPYEKSCNLIPPAIERISNYLTGLEQKIKDFIDNPPEKLTIPTTYFEKGKEIIRPVGFKHEEHGCYHYRSYESEYANILRNMQYDLKANKEFKEYLEKRLKEWKGE